MKPKDLSVYNKKISGVTNIVLYTWISVAVVYLTGGPSGILAASGSPVTGLMERITIGAFLQWLCIFSMLLYTTQATNTFTKK